MSLLAIKAKREEAKAEHLLQAADDVRFDRMIEAIYWFREIGASRRLVFVEEAVKYCVDRETGQC